MWSQGSAEQSVIYNKLRSKQILYRPIYKSIDLYAKHFIFLLIKNQILFILIQILSMSLVLLIGPKQVDQIHWTVFVPLGLIIHITFNSMRNPGYTGRLDSVQEKSVSEWILAVRAPQHGGQAGGHRLSKNGHMSIHHWLNSWTWDGELLNLIFTWGFRSMTRMAWVILHQAL